MSPTPKDFAVAIIGGGLCGLACAHGLAKAGIRVDLFESTAQFHQVGAGVGIGPNAIRALDKLGLLDVLLKAVDEPEPNQRLFFFLDGAGNHEKVFDYRESYGNHGHQGLAVYRPLYLDAVMPLLNPNTIHFNKRCIAVEEIESGRLLLRFSDGTFHETDLVIGADGIKSTIRTAVLPPNTRHLAFSGSYAYRALIPMDILMAEGIKADIKHRPYCWVGKNKHIITLPIKNNTVLNVVALYNISGGDMIPELPQPWVESASEQEVMDRFSDWGRDSRAILKHMKQPTKWSIHTTYPPLKNYVKGKIVLIGDAAHAMVPHLGAGAGQGFEDTYALCRLLAHPTVHKANLEDALKIYNEIRPPRASMVLERSIRMGRIYENYGPGLYDIPKMVQKLTGMWEPVWNFDLETQISRALQYFDKLKQKL